MQCVAPDQAFAIARRDLGKPAALSKEFAKAGKPRWRRWLVAGWAMFAASFALPAVGEYTTGSGLFTLKHGALSGWDACWEALFWGDGLGPWSALTNLLMLVSLVTLAIRRRPARRWLPALLAVAGSHEPRVLADLDSDRRCTTHESAAGLLGLGDLFSFAYRGGCGCLPGSGQPPSGVVAAKS